MSGNRLFLLLFVFALIFSCEEEEESMLTYPSVYHKAGIESIANLRVFSSSGEIKNSSIISRYSQYDTAYFKSYSSYIGNDPGIMDTVFFFNGQRAVLSNYETKLDCQLTRESNRLVMTETDATSRCCTYGEVITRSLPYYLVKVKPEVLSESIYSSVRGNYNFSFFGRQKYVFNESHGQLVAPMILYIMHSGNFDSGFTNNILQPDFYTHLTSSDTVTIMEFEILFEK